MDKNLQASQQRAIQYWFADGLAELTGGVLGLLLAIYFCVQQILQSAQGIFALLFLFVFVIAFGIRKLMLWYRERSTYPRTGYVEVKNEREDHKLLGVEVGFTLLLIGFMLYTILRGIQTVVWMPAVAGVVLAFIFALAGYQTKLVRFLFLGAFCLLLGGFLALSGLGDLWGSAILSLGTSLVLFAFGIITRLAYVNQIKTTAKQSDER
jgi:MFS family permease